MMPREVEHKSLTQMCFEFNHDNLELKHQCLLITNAVQQRM